MEADNDSGQSNSNNGNEGGAHERLRIVPVYAVAPGLAVFVLEKMGDMALKDPYADINLVIRSEGGDAYELLATIDAIRVVQQDLLKPTAKVVGMVHGYAFSAGSALLQACDERRITHSSYLMVHGITSGFFHGDERTLDRERELIHDLRETYAEMYAARSTKPLDYWREVMSTNTPTYFTAEESLSAGLVDVVIDNRQRKSV